MADSINNTTTITLAINEAKVRLSGERSRLAALNRSAQHTANEIHDAVQAITALVLKPIINKHFQDGQWSRYMARRLYQLQVTCSEPDCSQLLHDVRTDYKLTPDEFSLIDVVELGLRQMVNLKEHFERESQSAVYAVIAADEDLAALIEQANNEQ